MLAKARNLFSPRPATAAFSARYHLMMIMVIVSLGTAAAQSPDEQSIGQAIEALKHVMVQPDKTVLADLASDDLVYVHSSGTVRDKRGFIDEFMKGWTKFTKVTLSDQTINVTDNLAVVRHRLVADADIPGYPPVIDILIMMVWKKEGRQWKMLARQAVKLP